MKNILLLGDSIRLSYRERVAEILKSEAVIYGPDENCRFSAYTLFNLSSWLGERDYDAIHWNNGQWDTCYMLDGHIHTALTAYLELQERIATILRPRTRRLIFATTTPVWPEMFDARDVNPRKNEDIIRYNAEAAKVMARLGIEVNDLHSVVYADIKRYICDDMVHLTEEGIDLCAGNVANIVSGD